jgi:predicted DNA-binding protein
MASKKYEYVSIAVKPETKKLIQEMADREGRTVAGYIRHKLALSLTPKREPGGARDLDS